MAIVPVINGQVIEKTGITTMHGAVRTSVNAMARADLQRFTFNQDQTENIYVAGGSYDTMVGGVSAFRVLKEIDHTDVVEADLTTTTMDKVIDWTPGSLTTSLEPCIFLITADFDTTDWEPGSGIDNARHAGVFALSASFSDAPVVHEFFDNDLTAQGVVRARPVMADEFSAADATVRMQAHVPAGIVAIYDGREAPTAFTVHRITLWAAACRCGAGAPGLIADPGDSAFFSVSRATINIFAIRNS